MEEADSNPELKDDASSAPQDVNTPAAASSGQQDELADDDRITGADSGSDALQILSLSSQHYSGTCKFLSEDIESRFQSSDIAKSTCATEIECVSFDFGESTSDSAQSASGIKSPLSELKGDQVNRDASSTSYLAQSTGGFQTPPEEASITSDIFSLPPSEPISELCPLNIPPFEPVSELCQLCGTKLCHEHQDHAILRCGHWVHIVCLCVIHGVDSSHLSFCTACRANSGAQ